MKDKGAGREVMTPMERRYAGLQIAPGTDMAGKDKVRPEPVPAREDQMTVNRLATLLANGVPVSAGDSFPNGWEDCSSGRKRRYTAAREEHLTAARRLLGWERGDERPKTAS